MNRCPAKRFRASARGFPLSAMLEKSGFHFRTHADRASAGRLVLCCSCRYTQETEKRQYRRDASYGAKTVGEIRQFTGTVNKKSGAAEAAPLFCDVFSVSERRNYLTSGLFRIACAAARRAIGTRNGEQET